MVKRGINYCVPLLGSKAQNVVGWLEKCGYYSLTIFFYCMLWFDPLALVSGKLLNLSKVLREHVAGLAYNVFQESSQHIDGAK